MNLTRPVEEEFIAVRPTEEFIAVRSCGWSFRWVSPRPLPHVDKISVAHSPANSHVRPCFSDFV